MSSQPLKVLVFSTLYPNQREPLKGLFVEQRVRQWHAAGRTETRVVAPVPWWPFKQSAFGKYADYAQVPASESRKGLSVLHPRYPVLPKIGMTLAPLVMALALLPTFRRAAREWPFDLIDAHYFYPDGVAAVLLGAWLNKPVVVTARGSDINLLTRYWLPRTMIRWAASRAAMNVTVARALRDRLIAIGTDPAHVQVVPNGVDVEMFVPTDREAARKQLNLPSPLMLSVGRLVKAKGHDLAIEALQQLPGWHLAIVGDGDGESLRRHAQRLGVADRVILAGALAQSQLAPWYSAADVLVLASEMEGMPNVVLEALACGTPVVASRVGDVADIVSSPAIGRVLPERTASAIAQAVRDLSSERPTVRDVRASAERFSWLRTSEAQLNLFAAAVAR